MYGPAVVFVLEQEPPYFIAPRPRRGPPPNPPEPVEVNIGIKNVTGKDLSNVRVELDATDENGKKLLTNFPLRRLHDVPPYKLENVLRGDREVMIFGLFRTMSGSKEVRVYGASTDVPALFYGLRFQITVSGTDFLSQKKTIRLPMGTAGILAGASLGDAQ